MTAEEEQDNLGDDICKWCPIPKEAQGVRCYGGPVIMCEGSRCTEAMEAFYEDQMGELEMSMDELLEKAPSLILALIKENDGTKEI